MRKQHIYFGYDTNKLKYIGHGYEGKVYLLPDDKVIKVFYNKNASIMQAKILLKAQNSRFFPTVFNFDENSIIMSFVLGNELSYYFKKNPIDKNISLELVKLIEEFKRLGFTRLDMRLEHIFLQPDNTIKAIDPRGSYDIKQSYPKLMLKGLKKCNKLKDFFNFIKNDYPDYYKYWSKFYK